MSNPQAATICDSRGVGVLLRRCPWYRSDDRLCVVQRDPRTFMLRAYAQVGLRPTFGGWKNFWVSKELNKIGLKYVIRVWSLKLLRKWSWELFRLS